MHKRLGGLPDTAWVGGLQRRGGKGRGKGIKEKGRFLNKGAYDIIWRAKTLDLENLEENMLKCGNTGHF